MGEFDSKFWNRYLELKEEYDELIDKYHRKDNAARSKEEEKEAKALFDKAIEAHKKWQRFIIEYRKNI